jgi:hypothetical protein
METKALKSRREKAKVYSFYHICVYKYFLQAQLSSLIIQSSRRITLTNIADLFLAYFC